MMNKELQQDMVSAIINGDAATFEQLALQAGTGFSTFLSTQITEYHFPLTLACLKGSTRIATFMLQQGAAINQPDNLDHNTPLHLAAEQGDTDMVQLLLLHKADLRARTSDGGFLPIHYAAENGHTEIVDMLLAAGNKVDVKSTTRQTPLYLAAEKGQGVTVELLIARGAKVNTICDSGGDTALTAACYGNHITVARYLLTQGASPNGMDDKAPGDFYDFPLSRATSAEMVNLLIEAGADVQARNKYNTTALHAAVDRVNNCGPANPKWEQYSAAVKALLTHGADPLAKNNDHVNTPLARSKWPEITALLHNTDAKNTAAAGNPATAFGESMFRMAHNCDTENKIKSLLELLRQANAEDISYISTKDNNATLLHNIISSAPFNHSYSKVPFAPYMKAVALALEKGTDINAAGHLRTETPLHIAVRRSSQAGRYDVAEYHNGYMELIRLLLDSKADTNMPNKHGATVLDLATYAPVIDLLKTYGATYNTLDSEVAAEIGAGKMDVFDKGMPLELSDKDGNTPLIVAALKNNVTAIAYLVSLGADTRVRNTSWKNNALDMACLSGSFHAIRYIVEHLPIDINASDPESNDTALHYMAAWQPGYQCKDPAAMKKMADETCIWMIQQGAAVDLKNKSGKTAPDMARTKKLAIEMTKAAKKK